MKKCCKNCKWAIWQRTAKGNILRNVSGTCGFPQMELPKLPECSMATIERLNSRYGIWPDDGDECAVYQQLP